MAEITMKTTTQSFDNNDPFPVVPVCTPIKAIPPVGSGDTPSTAASSTNGDDILLHFNSAGSASPPFSPLATVSLASQGSQEPNQEQRRNSTISNTSSLESGSVGNKSHKSFHPLDDPNFCPPPPRPIPTSDVMTQFHATESPEEFLPKYELITHSGRCLSRLSFLSLMVKRWKPIFWITYGKYEIYFFRSEEHFRQWLTNVHLSTRERDALVKLKVNFDKDLNDDVEGYQATIVRSKWYKKGGTLHNFKLDRWYFEGGPSIAGAFASQDADGVEDLYKIMMGMMRRSPLNKLFMDGLMNSRDQDYFGDEYLGRWSRNNSMAISIQSVPDYNSSLPHLTEGVIKTNASFGSESQFSAITTPTMDRRESHATACSC